MIIRDNPSGRRTLRSYRYNTGELSKSLEKLSSGYRINRSADDAAGLAISEKMRANITGLRRAHDNSAEGTSLLQIGEGALDEIHQMLNRAAFLAGASANGTYTDELDRESLQRELDQLCSEIDRVTKNTRFNTVHLFQDEGYEYETSEGPAFAAQAAGTLAEGAGTPAEGGGSSGQAAGVNIVYAEHASVSATPSGVGGSGLGSLEKTVTYSDGSSKPLSKVLEEEIVPNTVKNVLRNYPAFSYLNGSTIGIGLEYFSESAGTGSTTMAAVRIGYTVPGSNYLNYTLRVNTAVLANTPSRESLQELEATIAHEMIHAFMDEALTAGMTGQGRDPADPTGNTVSVTKFPSWFVEGMAQTASGPGNWLRHMGILSTASDADISAAIRKESISSVNGSGSTASQYGTGYLACMYLGAVIGGDPSAASAETILVGLNRLLNEVIGGKSLDAAIQSLTNGVFTSSRDFEEKFGSSKFSASVGDFTRSLLTATGGGKGGLISGDLSASDLVPDVPDTSVSLFKLDPASGTVKNLYPSGHEIYSGGATDTDGVPPTGFTPGNLQVDCGDFIVTGAAAGDIAYDSATHVLRIQSGGDLKITMKTPAAPTLLDKIVVDASTTGRITLSGVQTTVADAISVEDGANVEFLIEGENDVGDIALGSGASAVFGGSGTLKTGTFSSDGTNAVTFRSGAFIVGDGTAAVAGNVTVDHAFVGAALTQPVRNSAGNPVKPIAPAWSPELDAFMGGNVTSVTIDGTEYPVSIPYGQKGSFWFDPGSTHRVTFTGTAGGKTVSKTLIAEPDANGDLSWKIPDIPFTVTGGTRGTDWDYDDATNTLQVLTNTELTISGGRLTEDDGTTTIGRIEIADHIAADSANPLKLNLNGVECVMKDDVSALSLGEGNHVVLNLTDGSTNTLTSGLNHAGVSIGDGTHLTITGDTGILNATGGNYGAGIGRSSAATSDMTSSVTIDGGIINARGGDYGAGIGCAGPNGSDFGDITIKKGTIHAEGGRNGGAGIGGANSARVGNITIQDGDITAKSGGHGAGIGGGWTRWATNGAINITGGRITALSLYHGTGIGSGCQGTSGKITIGGSAVIVSALGGTDGAGIGASWLGACNGIEITGDAEILLAQGGDKGAGIGAGSSGSKALGTSVPQYEDDGSPKLDENGNPIVETTPAILIDTSKTVTAKGGRDGVGIGSGYGGSEVGDIEIKQGVVSAIGSTDSTGIGAGRGSSGGNITIGDSNNSNSKVIVSAIGGMTENGGNILSYTDPQHKNEGTLKIIGDNTSVRPGPEGEGLYSTSKAFDEDGDRIFAYPLYLFQVPEGSEPLADGKDLFPDGFPLPDDATGITIIVDEGKGPPEERVFVTDLNHKPLDDNHAFLWMKGKDHKLTVKYTSGGSSNSTVLDLKFYEDSGKFRAVRQKKPDPAKEPVYNNPDPGPSVDPDYTNPSAPAPSRPRPQPEPEPAPEPEPPRRGRGLILQIGARTGETLEIPLFYLSREALGLEGLNIATQENAWKSMPVIRNAINRVSDIRGAYGAYMNRLEHNRADLSQAAENLTEAESLIRDTDAAKEYMNYVKRNILNQAAQSMLAHSSQDAGRVLQLLQ